MMLCFSTSTLSFFVQLSEGDVFEIRIIDIQFLRDSRCSFQPRMNEP